MRNRFASLLTVLTILFSQNACEDGSSPFFPRLSEEYFPLQVGNRWTYSLQYPSGTYVLQYEIVDTRTIGSHEYFVSRRSFDLAVNQDSSYYRIDASGRIFTNREGEDALYIDFNRDVGESWESYSDYVARISKRDFEMNVPLGRFENCIEVFFDYPPAIDDELWEVYSPGIGPVEFRGQIGSLQLVSAVVNGVEIE